MVGFLVFSLLVGVVLLVDGLVLVGYCCGGGVFLAEEEGGEK